MSSFGKGEVENHARAEIRDADADKAMALPNDYVFIFAGGEMPFEFLKKTGIKFQEQVVA